MINSIVVRDGDLYNSVNPDQNLAEPTNISLRPQYANKDAKKKLQFLRVSRNQAHTNAMTVMPPQTPGIIQNNIKTHYRELSDRKLRSSSCIKDPNSQQELSLLNTVPLDFIEVPRYSGGGRYQTISKSRNSKFSSSKTQNVQMGSRSQKRHSKKEKEVISIYSPIRFSIQPGMTSKVFSNMDLKIEFKCSKYQ